MFRRSIGGVNRESRSVLRHRRFFRYLSCAKVTKSPLEVTGLRRGGSMLPPAAVVLPLFSPA